MEIFQHDFEQIFKQNYSTLCFYASKFVGEDIIAEDIVQEIFSNLWEKHIVLGSGSLLKAYLFRSVHNRCINYLNHKKVTDKHLHIIKDKLAMMELEYYNSEHGTAKSLFEMEIKIEGVIALLPPQCGKVFELSRQKGYKNKEIATELNISVSVVEKHISKALRIMRDALKDYLIVLLFFLKIF